MVIRFKRKKKTSQRDRTGQKVLKELVECQVQLGERGERAGGHAAASYTEDKDEEGMNVCVHEDRKEE